MAGDGPGRRRGSGRSHQRARPEDRRRPAPGQLLESLQRRRLRLAAAFLAHGALQLVVGVLVAGVEQQRLLEETYKQFVRAGANLDQDAQARLREINAELASLSQDFRNNLLEETNAFEMLVTDRADLGNLPESLVASAAAEAQRQLDEALAEAAERPAPSYARWPRVLGLMVVVLIGVEIFTGSLLALYYLPTPESAHGSLGTILRDVSSGSLVRQMGKTLAPRKPPR